MHCVRAQDDACGLLVPQSSFASMRRLSGICSATTGQQPSEPQRIDVAALLALNAASEEAAQDAREAETHICGGTARAEMETETEAAGVSDRYEAGARMGETSNSSADPSGPAAEGGAQVAEHVGDGAADCAGQGRAGKAEGEAEADVFAALEPQSSRRGKPKIRHDPRAHSHASTCASARARTAAHARTQAWRPYGPCIALRCVARHVLMYGTGRAVASCRARCNLHLRALVRVHVGVRVRMSTRFVRRDVARAYRMAPLRLFGIDATCHCIDRCPFDAAKRCSRLRPRPFGSGAVETVRWLDSGHPNRRHVPSHVSASAERTDVIQPLHWQ